MAALLLGFAIQLNFGRLSTGAILLATLAFALTIIGVIGPRWPLLAERNVLFALGLALAIQFGLLVVWPPGAGNALQDSTTLLPFRVAMAAAGVTSISTLVIPRRAGWRIAAVIAIYLFAGAWVIALSPNPANDVYQVQHVAAQALLVGRDPYAIQLPNIYGPGSGYYAPSLERGDLLAFGYPYPPLSLLLALPGVLLGDVRWVLLAASAVAAILVMSSRPGRIASAAGLLLLFTPRTFFIVEQAWTEPIIVLLLALGVWLASRASRLTPVGIGLLAAAKQHMLLTLPLAVLLVPHPLRWRRIALPGSVAAGVIVAVSLPLAAWDFGAFWHSVIEVQLLQPARLDALAYPAWLFPQFPQVASVAGFLVLIPAGALIYVRSARTPAGFAGAVALAYFAFFLFGRQAFANYYYMVIGALCAAVSATSQIRQGPGEVLDRGHTRVDERTGRSAG